MIEEIKSIIKELSDHLSADSLEIEVTEQKDSLVINLKTQDERAFIGKENERFEAFSHLIKKILSRKVGEEIKVIVDINNLRGKNDDALKIKATIVADRARAFKADMELEPMTSYQRRVIHSHLEGSPLIKTESVGEGKERRLVIRYVGDVSSSETI